MLFCSYSQVVPETKLGKGCGNLIAFIRSTDTQWKKQASFFLSILALKRQERCWCAQKPVWFVWVFLLYQSEIVPLKMVLTHQDMQTPA